MKGTVDTEARAVIC